MQYYRQFDILIFKQFNYRSPVIYCQLIPPSFIQTWHVSHKLVYSIYYTNILQYHIHAVFEP